jgi:hypothetical protein
VSNSGFSSQVCRPIVAAGLLFCLACQSPAAEGAVSRTASADFGYFGGGTVNLGPDRAATWQSSVDIPLFSKRQAADRQPYMNSIDTRNYGSMGVAKFEVASLPIQSHYYLEISPWSVFSSSTPGIAPVSIYSWADDDLNFIGTDRSRGTFHFLAPIVDPDVASWYDANAYGGFAGDTYVDVTSLVSAARTAGHDYLSFRYEISPWLSGGSLDGQLLREPFLVGSNSAIPLQPLPGPGVLSAVLLAPRLLRRRGR